MISHHQKIRALLTDTDGLTIKEIITAMDVDKRVITRSLKSMPDIYIDRWVGPRRGQWCAVWCVATVPKDCPKPE